MAEKKTRVQLNATLKRRATAASLGVLFGAFALVAATTQGSHMVSQAAVPQAETALVTSAASAAQEAQATVTVPGQPVTQAATQVPATTTTSHAVTRQS